MKSHEEHIREIASDPLIRDYHDRGMMKWQGMFLSEHTTALKQEEAAANQVVYRHEQMEINKKTELLYFAFSHVKVVLVQVGEINLGWNQQERVIGIVNGFDEGNVFIDGKPYDIDEIEYVEIYKKD